MQTNDTGNLAEMQSVEKSVSEDGMWEQECEFCSELFFSPESLVSHIVKWHADETIDNHGCITYLKVE